MPPPPWSCRRPLCPPRSGPAVTGTRRCAARGPLRAMLFLALALTWSWSMGAAAETAPATLPPVHVVQVEGTLDGITARFLLDRLNSAGAEGAQVVVVTIDSAASVAVDPSPLVAAVRASRVP